MADLVAAIDQGTTSTRCILFDRAGTSVSSHQIEHDQIMPRAGWVEHDPLQIWQRTETVVQQSMAAGGVSASDIAAVGITNQRETTIVWNRRTGQPYHNAIVWQDTRTAQLVGDLDRAGTGDLIRERAGIPPATYFAGGKLAWLLAEVDGLRAAAEAGDALFGTIDTWLLWNLTGGTDGGRHLTDVTNASRTMLMNLAELRWDDQLLELFDIPRAMLPEIVPSSHAEKFGTTRTAFGGEVVIGGVLGDQHAAMVGQVCLDEGDAKNTYGTGNFLLMNTGTEIVHSTHGLLSTVCYQFGDEPARYALEGSIAVTGSAIQWLRDQLGIVSSAAEADRLAQSVPDTGGLYFVPAFSGLFAPVLAAGRARRHRRHDPVPHRGPPGPGDVRVDLLLQLRPGQGDGGRRGGDHDLAQGRRRGHREWARDAAAGRRPRHRRDPARGPRDDRPRRRLRGRPGRRGVGDAGGLPGQLARGSPLDLLDRPGGPRRRHQGLAQGHRAHPELGRRR